MLLNIIKYSLMRNKIINAYSINFGLRHISTHSTWYLVLDICGKIIIFIDSYVDLSYLGYVFMMVQKRIFASAIETAKSVLKVFRLLFAQVNNRAVIVNFDSSNLFLYSSKQLWASLFIIVPGSLACENNVISSWKDNTTLAESILDLHNDIMFFLTFIIAFALYGIIASMVKFSQTDREDSTVHTDDKSTLGLNNTQYRLEFYKVLEAIFEMRTFLCIFISILLIITLQEHGPDYVINPYSVHVSDESAQAHLDIRPIESCTPDNTPSRLATSREVSTTYSVQTDLRQVDRDIWTDHSPINPRRAVSALHSSQPKGLTWSEQQFANIIKSQGRILMRMDVDWVEPVVQYRIWPRVGVDFYAEVQQRLDCCNYVTQRVIAPAPWDHYGHVPPSILRQDWNYNALRVLYRRGGA